MRVILSNYRYFISGGPERYLFSVKELFENNGMEVFPFSVKSRRNIPSRWEQYYISAIDSSGSAYFREYRKDFKTMLKVLERGFYSAEGFLKAKEYAQHVDPDIVYSLHFMNKMSPSIIDGFKSCGIPVVARLSDFSLICPQGLLYCRGSICERCLKSSFLNSPVNRCVHNSVANSLAKALALYFHRLIGTMSRIDAFVCPTDFLRTKYIEAGFPADKMHHIPTFIDVSRTKADSSAGEYFLFFGRLTEEKGVHVLLDAYSQIPGNKPHLQIIGDLDDSEYSRKLICKYSPEVTFLNFMPKEQLERYIANAFLVVIPSLCYDNLPNVLLEAYAYRKAVIASNHGCFSGIIQTGRTGMLFEAGNAEDLADKMTWAMQHRKEVCEMGKNAGEYVKRHHSAQDHYDHLMTLFESLS